MRDTLENLYFGKITPNEHDITPGSVLADAMDRAEQCEEKLTALLEGEEKSSTPTRQSTTTIERTMLPPAAMAATTPRAALTTDCTALAAARVRAFHVTATLDV